MIGYIKYFNNGNKNISFKVIDKTLSKKYTKIWEKISILMNRKFYSKPIFGNSDSNKCIKTKLKLYWNKTNTNFQGEKVPKGDTSYKCLSLIMLEACY